MISGGTMSINEAVRDIATLCEEQSSVPQSAVSKALTLLELLAEWKGGSATLSELARAAGLPKSSTHRLLRELELHDLVDRVGLKYRVGGRFFEMSLSARWSQHGHMRDVAAPILEQLYERTRLTVHLAVLQGRDVLYLEKITAPHGSGIPSRVGGRMPATCTALGKALLAYSPPAVVRAALVGEVARPTKWSPREPTLLLEQLRLAASTGAAHEHDEAKVGLSCVAAPVLIGTRPLAAISLSGYRWTNDPKAYVPLLRGAAADIAKRLSA